MKRWIALVLLLICLAPSARAREATEQREEIAGRTAYILDYDWDLLPEWNAREYLEAPGTVAALYCDSASADALISLVPRDAAANASDYLLTQARNDMGAMVVGETVGPELWQAPWGETGAAMEQAFVYVSGEYTSDPYRKKTYAAQLNEEYFLTVTVTAVEDGAREVITAFEEAFFVESMRVRPVEISARGYAYLHAAQLAEDGLEVSLDTFIVEEGDETSEMVIYNNDPSLATCAVSADANIWLMPQGELFTWECVPHDAALLSTYISDFVLANASYPPFLVYYYGDQIVWMEQQGSMIQPLT